MAEKETGTLYNVVILERVGDVTRKLRTYKKRIPGRWVSFYHAPHPSYGRCLVQKGKTGAYANPKGTGAIIIRLESVV